MTARAVVSLRPVRAGDLDYLFALVRDPEARRMAAFTARDPDDRAAFDAHWARLPASPDVNRLVLVDGAPAGHAAVYGPPGEREVTYWIDRAHWGRGVATAALSALLDLVPERPLRARAATDNAASCRVLRKCGFVATGHDRGWAHGRGEEVDEVVFTLR
ncbi:GNAT family N-acetyltransferase [Streptomyces thermolilacinus]|uniref:GNAT family N-acetyltransferase n=1 Tax=Streptomyces thermolilacinus SPC6 TaxID=1306406 RepID=A0A1D3DWT4_9ACTN|nr:GNAT family N-acetyltransferase [Streptomyces thermolilacinus]OEJ96776.1 GNAT family N-acetyltransferase [Streptomyces thermolilacinus SPC6]